MMAKTEVSLNHPIATAPQRPSHATQLALFLIKNKRDDQEEVAMIVTPAHYESVERVVLFVSLVDAEGLTWCNAQYLDDTYYFVRYLNKDEHVKIYGTQ